MLRCLLLLKCTHFDLFIELSSFLNFHASCMGVIELMGEVKLVKWIIHNHQISGIEPSKLTMILLAITT